jgi:choline-sulfatase
MPRLRCFAGLLIPFLACSKPKTDGEVHRVASSPKVAAVPAAPTAPEPSKPTPKRPYNVVLIIIDAMRADMPWNGYQRDIMPWLTRFQAEHCVTYTQGYSLSSYTAKSVVPALVGKYPSEMVRDGYFFTKWPDADNLFLTERLQKAGLRTLSGQAHGYFLPALGNDQGYDDFRLISGNVDLKAVTSVTDDKLAALAREMLSSADNVRQDQGRRFFAYFHFMDPHHTYERHPGYPEFGNEPRDLYDGELRWTDHWVGTLVDWALTQPWAKQTVFLFMGDHGEGFGEHNQYRHAYELWESLVKVPMMFCVPDAPARKLEVRRSQIDLAPTILDLMGVSKPDPPLRGQSLVPELFGAPEPARPIVVDLPRCDLMDRRRGVIVDGWKILAFGDDARWELYDLNRDPTELHDLSKTEPEKLEQMKAKYAEISATIPNVPVIGGAPLKGAPRGRRW